MDEQLGLGENARVAIIGGGICGAAMAAALLFTARARGRSVDVRVFDGTGEEDQHRAPVVLSADCRARLAALGCRILPEWRAVELTGVEVISGRSRHLLRSPSGPLWVVDAWPEGLAGRTMVARGLSSVAALHGAKFVSRRVDRVEVVGRSASERAQQNGTGSLVIWAAGANERAHAAVLAAGPASELGDRFFDGFSPAPTLPAAHARLSYPPLLHTPPTVAKVLLAPLPGVDALYLIPTRGSIYALAYGPDATPADLCQALMMAARDGHLGEGFEVSHLSATRVPNGIGSRLCAPGQLAVGPSAVGHPLSFGISEALATCSRAAIALVDAAADGPTLKRRYVRDGIFDLIEDARAASRANQFLVTAGERASAVLARAETACLQTPVYGGGIYGLSAPSPAAVATRARWASFVTRISSMWRSAVDPVPTVVPQLEPALYYVVDDDPEMRSSLTELLESRGAEVVAFADELALFSAVARRRPAAILLDVVLSWVDGLRLCEELKRHPLTRDTRVLVMSGLNRPYVRDRALRAGAERFLSKPIPPERLLRALDPTVAHEPSWRRTNERAAPGALVETGAHAS